MILLDTNIISEMMKPCPDTQVMNWLDQQESMQLFISTITIAEIAYGLNALPEGQRRSRLEDAFNRAINMSFKHRILPFDIAAAYVYAKLMSRGKAPGLRLSVPDGQIAAIASAQGCILATRNVRDFESCGLEVISPFAA